MEGSLHQTRWIWWVWCRGVFLSITGRVSVCWCSSFPLGGQSAVGSSGGSKPDAAVRRCLTNHPLITTTSTTTTTHRLVIKMAWNGSQRVVERSCKVVSLEPRSAAWRLAHLTGSLSLRPLTHSFKVLICCRTSFAFFVAFIMRIISFPYKRSTRGLTLVCLNGHQNLAPDQSSDSVVQITHT